MVKTATLQVAKCVEKGLGYQLLLWRLDPKGCGNSASHDTLSFPGPPPQELPFAAVSRGFHKAFFIKDIHSQRICTQAPWAWVTSQALLSWDSSCPMLSCVCWGRRGAWCLPPPGGTVSIQSESRWHLEAWGDF